MVQKCIMGSSGGGSSAKVLDLFAHTEDNTAITGGWTINNGNWDANGIYISNNGTNNYTAYTNNKIDLSNYSKLLVYGNIASQYYVGASVKVYSSTPPTIIDSTTPIADASFTQAGTSFVEVDISSISEGYVCLTSGTAPSVGTSYYYGAILLP